MEVWQFISDKVQASYPVILLWVLESEGSSPGRRGFKMAVASDGTFFGTIGGGIMEHKLVEKSKALLLKRVNTISLLRQYHDKQHAKDQSGMICSGSQLVAFVPFSTSERSLITDIIMSAKNRNATLQLSPKGILLKEGRLADLLYKTAEEWSYSEPVDERPVVHLVGGGHVSLALSEVLSFLGFYSKVYDDRSNLSTLVNNHFAQEKHHINYHEIGTVIKGSKEEFAVIMTVGYRDDKIVFKQLFNKDFFYLGMMGSKAKIEALYKELENEGLDPERWNHCFAPIGINIHSKTANEIAVSIAAEIIREKNKCLPTGRIENRDK